MVVKFEMMEIKIMEMVDLVNVQSKQATIEILHNHQYDQAFVEILLVRVLR